MKRESMGVISKQNTRNLDSSLEATQQSTRDWYVVIESARLSFLSFSSFSVSL